jgi:hypothetical protein
MRFLHPQPQLSAATMFYDQDKLPAFSFEKNASHTVEHERRHLLNQLRLEFRTASQRQLVDAADAAFESTRAYADEKTLREARLLLSRLLRPARETPDDPGPSEPPFRAG